MNSELEGGGHRMSRVIRHLADSHIFTSALHVLTQDEASLSVKLSHHWTLDPCGWFCIGHRFLGATTMPCGDDSEPGTTV